MCLFHSAFKRDLGLIDPAGHLVHLQVDTDPCLILVAYIGFFQDLAQALSSDRKPFILQFFLDRLFQLAEFAELRRLQFFFQLFIGKVSFLYFFLRITLRSSWMVS